MYPHRHIAMVTLMLAVFGSFHFSLGQDATPTTCQSLQSSICALQVNYTQTHFPNFVGHEHPNDAELQLQTFTPLIQFGCSEYLPQFLCAVLYPYCDSNGVKLPCQSVCHIVYDGCMPVLESFGFPWPSAMDCSLFPTQQGCFSVDTTTTKPIPAITSPEVPVIELSTVKPTQNTNVPSMVCEPLLSEKCLAYVNYNYTTYPNYFGNSDWRSADTTLRDMTFILQMQCSDYLPLFMCSVIHPKCADQSIVPPCQSLCQDVYDGCNSVFAQFDVEWPEYLDCSQFPSSEDSGDCVKISISEPEEPATPQCETVTLEMCGDFYNGTSLPNSVGHTRQSEVSEMMTQSFQAFASLGCSEYFSLLLCSMYLPKCDKSHGVMKPCQSLCQRVKDDCQAMLDSAGVPFPMDCEMTFLFSTESSPHCVSVDSISPSALPGCPDPGTVENGLISTNSGALTFPAVPGSQLTFICKDGFSLVGTPVSVCKFDSSWSLPLPQCIADCSDPGTPAHGYQIGTPSYQAYTTVSFNCDHGYQLAGAHIITCNDGVWSHTLPVCTGVQTSGVETTASSQSGDTQQPITDQNDKEQTSRRGYIRCTAERESDSYCLNGGTCFQLTVDGVQEQQCICHGNFTGKRCQERVLTDAERSRQEQADKKRNIAIGVGIGIACLVVLAIVIVLIIFCRKQMRHKTHYFSSRPDSAVFTNPAYDDVTLTRKDAESYPKEDDTRLIPTPKSDR